jgi:hypothetical protein
MTETIYVIEDKKKRKATDEEIVQIEKDRAKYEAEQKLFEAETTAKAEAKESGMAKLRKLGLTDDEIAGLIS